MIDIEKVKNWLCDNFYTSVHNGDYRDYTTLGVGFDNFEEMMAEPNIYGFFKYRDTIANVGHLESKNGISEEIYTYIDIESISVLMEFFHSHHIDYRGLIEKGLAIDATGLNIY